MTLRPLDREGRRAFLDELRPRFLAVAIRSGRMRVRWWVPTWALEEPLRFGLRLMPLVSRLRPARRYSRPAPLVEQIDAWFSEAHRDLLSMPDDRPLLDVATPRATLVIQEVRIP